MIKIINSEETWSRPHVGDAVIYSKDKRSHLTLRLYGLQHPECPDEHDWLEVGIELCSQGHVYRCVDFEFNRRGLQSSVQALSRLPNFSGTSTAILSDYPDSQTIRCEMESHKLLVKTDLHLGNGKAKAQFETTFPEVYRFRQMVKRFALLCPLTDDNPNLDFVAAFRESMSLGVVHTDAHKWVRQVITADFSRVGDILMKSVVRHLRRRRKKKRERSEIEIYRIRKFARRLAISKVFDGDHDLISQFESEST